MDTWIWQFPVQTPWVQFFDFLLLLMEKLKMTFWQNLMKSPETKRFVFGSNFCGFGVLLTARSFKEPNDKGLSSALLQPNINRPKQQRFVLGDFMRFAQNAIFNFSTRNFGPMQFYLETVIYIYKNVYVCTYIHTYTYIYIYMYIYIRIDVNIYIYVYI